MFSLYLISVSNITWFTLSARLRKRQRESKNEKERKKEATQMLLYAFLVFAPALWRLQRERAVCGGEGHA